jgi:hypothetical protein
MCKKNLTKLQITQTIQPVKNAQKKSKIPHTIQYEIE